MAKIRRRADRRSVVETQHVVVDERAAICGGIATLQTRRSRAAEHRVTRGYLWCNRNTAR
jgi:hypothetical protein